MHSLRVGLIVGLLLLVGCGDEETTATPTQTVPTSVSANDLERDGEFWRSLTPDLKEDLVNLAKDRRAEQRPEVANSTRASDNDELVAEIDQEYTNASKRGSEVFTVYGGVVSEQARETLDDAVNQLDQLCSGEAAPPECEE